MAAYKAVFRTKEAPDYQKILATFMLVAELLNKTARMDMPGTVAPKPYECGE